MNATNRVATTRDSIIDYIFRIAGKKGFYCIADTARILGVETQTLRNQIWRGTCPIPVRRDCGSRPKFWLDDIVEYLMRCIGDDGITSTPRRRGAPRKAERVVEAVR